MLRDLVLLKLKTMAVRTKMHQKVIESEERFATNNQLLRMRSTITHEVNGRLYSALQDMGIPEDAPSTPSAQSEVQNFADESARTEESADA